MAFNAGWVDIAHKLEKFIDYKGKKTVQVPSRTIEEALLCSYTIKRNKWTSKEMNVAEIHEKEGILHISDRHNHSDALSTSLVGTFQEGILEARHWASSSWKQAHGVNVYEVGQGRFLFEFCSKIDAEQVMRGDWCWKLYKVNLRWWSPTVGAIP